MKTVLQNLLLTCLFLSLYACTGSDKPKDNAKTKITIIGENSANIQSLMALEAEYEKLNPTIDLVFIPSTFTDAEVKTNQDFANGTGLYDIVMQYNFSLSSFVRNKYVYDIEELMKDVPDSLKKFEKDLFEKTWQSVGFYYKNGIDNKEGIKKVGYPFSANTMMLVYNKDFFENETNKNRYKEKYKQELAPPTTWEEFYTIADFFTEPKENKFGICLEGASGGYLYHEWSNYMHSMGGSVLDKERGWESSLSNKVVINSENNLKALKYFKSLKPFNASNFTNTEAFTELDYMKKGNIAMSISWDDIIVSKMIIDKTFKDIHKFGFAPMPSSKSVIGGGAFFVNKKSKNSKEAFKFILWVMQPSTQIALAKSGLSSPLKTTYDDKDIKKMPHSEALRQSLERGGIYPEAGPDATMISEKLTTYLQKCWNDELTPEKALEMMQKEIEAERAKIFKAIR